MAHFALVVNDVVKNVIVLSNEVVGEPENQYPETEPLGQAFIANTLNLPGLWLQTSYNGNFRGCYAGIGYTYNATLDEFVAPPSPPLPPLPPIEA